MARQHPVQVRGLLMGRLRTWRYRALLLRPGAAGAVAEGEDVGVARRLEFPRPHQRIDSVGLQPTQFFEKVWRLDACSPYHQLCRDLAAGCGLDTLLRHF